MAKIEDLTEAEKEKLVELVNMEYPYPEEVAIRHIIAMRTERRLPINNAVKSLDE